MKLYGDFEKEDWLRVLRMEEAAVPRSFIIHGEWNHKRNLELWKQILEKETALPKWNTVVGQYQNIRIGFANAFGAPVACSITHQFANAGTHTFIQTGYFGGLSDKARYGDILIVTGAEMKDGVSHWYLPGQSIVKSDESLVEAAVEYCIKHGYRYVTGTVLTTSAMLLETHDMVLEWSGRGHIGVDMETATTLAVAQKFNRKSISLLNMSDYLLAGDTLYSYSEERATLEVSTDQKIRELALYLGTL